MAGVKRSVFLLSAMIVLCSSVLAEYKLEHISLEQGISHNLIYSIYQDSKGFMWFGTMYGLVKYDGPNYTVYRYDPSDTNSLSNDNIISIYEDRKGFLWFGTFNGGLNKYDRNTGRFTRFVHNADNPNSLSNNIVWAELEDRNGILWIGTSGGLNKYQNGIFTAYTFDSVNNNSIGSNLVYSVTEDRSENVLWLGTFGGGLNKFDKSNNTFFIYKHKEADTGSISGNFVRPVYQDEKGNIWAGTFNKGLNKFNKSSGFFTHYLHTPSDPNSLSNNNINSIIEDRNGNLWIGVNGGVDMFDKASGKFELHSLMNDESRDEENCIAVYEDLSGIIWLGSYYGGLYKLYENRDKFATFRHSTSDKTSLINNNVRCIFEDRSSVMWVGTNAGLDKFDDGAKTFTHYEHDTLSSYSLSNDVVNSLAQDEEGNIWVGTAMGLNKLNIDLNRFIHYANDPADDNSISSNSITCLYKDKNGLMWVGSRLGLNRLDVSNNTFARYMKSASDSNSISDNDIFSIYEDPGGYIWIGTYGGLNRLNKSTGRFSHFIQNPFAPGTISNNYAYSFCTDQNGSFWIGTAGGLNKYNKNTGLFSNLTEKDGLPNSVICSILEDRAGALWISTNKGVSRFEVVLKSFRNFDIDDGLQSNMFNNGSFCRRKNGDFVFGGINGLSIFDPDRIRDIQEAAPPVILTSLIKYSGKEKKEIDISGAKEIRLAYNENLVTFGFAVIDYINPKKNQYSYMLEGFDKDWINSGNVSKAVYANLNPGEYLFKVKGANSDGVWNEKYASILLTITPPYWKTWWFYTFIVICSVLLIATFQNYRVRMKVKNLFELEKAKSREREIVRQQASSDYHDELGHKLTRISLYSRRIKKKMESESSGLVSDLDSIIETSNSLQSGAKDLIWALNPGEDTLFDAALRMKDFGNELFEINDINFIMNAIPDGFKSFKLSMNSKRHLTYIIKEGMNNVLKYAECKNVELNFSVRGNVLEVILSDDGKGFVIENVSKGYGLKNIVTRAEQIGGEIEIVSAPGNGTSIKLLVNI